MSNIQILYSFRRCPYAMRARMLISMCDIEVELRLGKIANSFNTNINKEKFSSLIAKLSNSKCQYVKLLNKFNDKIYFKKINFNFPVLFGKKNIEKKYLDYFYKKNNDLFLIEKRTIIDKDIFIPKGYRKTFGQLSIKVKNSIDHRFKAFTKIKKFF